MPSNTEHNLLSRLDAWRRESPDRPAIVEYDVHASREAGRLIQRSSPTAVDLWDGVIDLAAGLRSLGVGAGDVVAVQLPTWHEYLVAHLAAYAIGAVTMPVSPIYRARDISRQLAISQAAAMIVPGTYGNFDYVTMVKELQQQVPSLRHVVVVGEGAAEGIHRWRDVLAAGRAPALTRARDAIARGEHACPPDRLMLLNYSSGTTGEPKGIMHSTKTVDAAVSAAIERMSLSRKDVILISVTLGHAAGYLNGIYLPLMLRSRVVYMDSWNAGVALRVVEKERVSYGPAMPAYLFDLANHPDFGRIDISSWTTARVSGGSITRSLMASLQERLPTLRLCPGWGLSEALYVSGGAPEDPLEKRNYTEGRPLRGFEVEIRDATCTERLPTGEDGEILIRTPSLMLGYYRQEVLTRAAYTPDGWLKTGDVGHLDADGYITMIGRSKELIVRGGENVPTLEVENLLMEHPKVAAAALVGVPDARLGEKACAVIEPKSAADPLSFGEMQEFLVKRQLTKHFIPEYLVTVESLPKTAVGKIRKQELKARVLEKLAL